MRILPMAKQTGSAVGLISIGACILFTSTHPENSASHRRYIAASWLVTSFLGWLVARYASARMHSGISKVLN